MKRILYYILAITLLCSVASATLRNAQKFEFFNNAGGLNDKLSPIIIKDEEASDLQNVEFTVGGAIKKRNGYSSDNAAFVGQITGIYHYVQNDGTDFLIETGDTSIFNAPAINGFPKDITGALTITSNSSALFDFTTANNNLIATNKTDQVITWNGTGNATDLTAAPQGRYIEFHQNIVFIANCSTDTTGAADEEPSRLYFSNVLDETTWTSTDFIDIAKDDGTEITGLVVLLDTLYIFKDNSIFRLSGTNRDDFTLARMVTAIGCVSGHSIQVINNKIIFNSQDGIYIYDGGINVTKISTRIEDTLDGIDTSRFEQFTSANFQRKNQYWLGTTSSAASTNDLILVYDYFNDAWTKYVGIEANAMAIVRDSTGKEQLYTGEFDRGAIFLQNVGDNDDGIAINGFYQTKWFRFPTLKSSELILRLIRVFAEEEGNWDLTIEAKQDFATTSTSNTMTLTGSGGVWGTAVWGTDVWGGEGVIVGRFPLTLRENFFQLKFENKNADEPFKIFGYQFFVEPTDRI